MKRFAVVLCIMFLFVGIAESYTNEQNGFRSFKWGDPLKESMNYIREDIFSNVRLYIIKNDSLKVGYGTAEKIEYGFYNDKFVLVRITIDGYSNYSLIYSSLISQFGSDCELLKKDVWKWTGNKTNIVISYDYKTGKGNLSFLNTDFINNDAKTDPNSGF